MVKAAVTALIVLVLIFAAYGQAAAQTPEPTPIPTPSYQQGVAMSTGNTLLIQKTVTYGDIAVTAALLLLVAIQLLTGMLIIPKMWMRKK